MSLGKKGSIVLVKGAVVLALLVAVGLVIYVKRGTSSNTPAIGVEASTKTVQLPRLVDLGSDKCVPCKMMAPVLVNLKAEYAGRLQVEFIDVWKNPDAKKQYGIAMIPTQVFYDASGKELFRHEGFLAKDDILSKWKELGVDLSSGK